MNKVRWGLLSTARINRSLIPAIRASKRGELVAVASRELDKAQKYAQEWAIPKAFGSYESMLKSGEIDAVYISLPNHLHAEWSIRSLESGVHVLCEKPFALSIEDVDQMITSSRQNNRVLAEAFMYRHHPQTKIAGQLISNGRIGDVCIVRGVFTFAIDSREDVRLVPEYGGGSLWDVGVYPLSMAQFIIGEPPQWVFGAQRIGDSGVEETFSGILHYSGGQTAQITSSFRAPFNTSVEVIGTEGRLTFTRPFNAMDQDRYLVLFDHSGKSIEIPVPERELYLGEVEDMHTAILDGEPPYISLAETRNHVRTVLALYQSAKLNEVVHL
jgi:xylose dehydrogenase (NAD/NADP)